MSEVTISEVRGCEILDSRGNPTIAVSLTTSDGKRASAAVPSGASTGAREALELRDDDTARYQGKGVLKAVEHVGGEIAKAVRGMPLGSLAHQTSLDRALIDLDGTETKARLGATSEFGS